MVKFFNTKEWPIIYLKSYNNYINDDLFELYKKQYLSLLIKCKNNKEKIILICDLTTLNNCENLPLNYIMKHANFNKEIYKYNKEYVKAVCILCSNSSLKNILNLYFTISKPASPYKIFKNNDKINKYLMDNFNIEFNISIFQKNDIDSSEEDSSTESLDISGLNLNDSNIISYLK